MPSRVATALAIALAGCTLAIAQGPEDRIGPLQRYVALPDDAFGFDVTGTAEGDGHTRYDVELASQVWAPAGAAAMRWTHRLTIIRPERVLTTTALLAVDDGPHDNAAVARWTAAAAKLHAVVAVLHGLPGHPVAMPDGPKTGRGLIDAGLIQYVETGEPEWVPLLPMVKSLVRAMDAVESVARRTFDPPEAVEAFAVAGGGLAAWPVWLAPAVDFRIVAIAPADFDALNMGRFFEPGGPADHPLASVAGTDSPAQRGALIDLVDPYARRYRLTLPKLILLPRPDPAGATTAAEAFFPGLLGPSHMAYGPETDGSMLDTAEGMDTLTAFAYAMLYNQPFPSIELERSLMGRARVRTSATVRDAELWRADGTGGWEATALERTAPDRFAVDEALLEGAVFFAAATFESPAFEGPYRLTTPAAQSVDRGIPRFIYLGPMVAAAWLVLIALIVWRWRRQNA